MAPTVQRTLTREDIETIDDPVWYELETWRFYRPGWWPTVVRACLLYESRMFGRVFDQIQRIELYAVETALHGNCDLSGGSHACCAREDCQGNHDTTVGTEL